MKTRRTRRPIRHNIITRLRRRYVRRSETLADVLGPYVVAVDNAADSVQEMQTATRQHQALEILARIPVRDIGR